MNRPSSRPRLHDSLPATALVFVLTRQKATHSAQRRHKAKDDSDQKAISKMGSWEKSLPLSPQTSSVKDVNSQMSKGRILMFCRWNIHATQTGTGNRTRMLLD
ncbi:hypothetical protein DL98DRAFT_138799 [Cadophora sp. DSE1049]|nr:hypothetical protein DL98DRAFT_138799 [Cadophora sp. DSE1049]